MSSEPEETPASPIESLPEWTIDGEIYTPEDFLGLLTAKNNKIADLEEKVEQLEEDVDEGEEERDELARELKSVEETTDVLDKRTNLLDVVQEVDNTSADQMRTCILQHMYRMIKDKEGDDRRYAMDVEKTTEILHRPDVDRTTVLRWMRTAPRHIGDESVCWYDGGDAGPTGAPARIFLDLRGDVDLPAEITTAGGSNNTR